MEGRLYRNAFYRTFKIKTQIKKKIGTQRLHISTKS